MGAAFRLIPRCSLPVRAVKSEPLPIEGLMGKEGLFPSADLTARLRQADGQLSGGRQRVVMQYSVEVRVRYRAGRSPRRLD